MTKLSQIQVRCSVEEKENWERQAELAGMSLSGYARALLNDPRFGYAPRGTPEPVRDVYVGSVVADAQPSGPPPHQVRSPKGPKKRTEMCEHRRAADDYCKVCD